jgi:WD40 repeat protein
MADSPAFDKAQLAWNLPWDADWVTAVAWLGPSRRVAAGNRLGDIFLWELPDKAGGEAPKPIRKLNGHTNCVNRLIASKDGNKLYSCSHDHTVRVWDLKAQTKGEETVTLNAVTRDQIMKRRGKVPAAIEAKVAVQSGATEYKNHSEWVVSMALSRDEKLLVSGDDNGLVLIQDAASGKELSRLKMKGWVYSLALSPDTKQVFVSERVPLVFDSGRRDAVAIYDRETGKPVQNLAALFKGQFLSAAAYSNDGKLLAVGRGGECDGMNGTVTLLEADTGKKVRALTPGHLNGLTDLAFHPDGKHLLSCGRDTVVSVWKIDDGKRVAQLGKPRGGQFKDWLHAITVSPDGKWLAAADMVGAVQVWALG